MSGAIIQTSLREDAIASLEAALDFALRARDDHRQWKWLIIAMHSTAQGFMVLALEHGNSLNAMRPRHAKRWLESHRTKSPQSDYALDTFEALYDKVKSPVVQNGFIVSKPFTPEKHHDENLISLNEIRNNFIHFSSSSWGIDIQRIVEICLSTLDLISFLGWESKTFHWHEPSLSERGARASQELRATLDALTQQTKSLTAPPPASSRAAWSARRGRWRAPGCWPPGLQGF